MLSLVLCEVKIIRNAALFTITFIVIIILFILLSLSSLLVLHHVVLSDEVCLLK